MVCITLGLKLIMTVFMSSPLQETDAAYYDKMISVMQRSFFLAIRYGGQAMCNTSASKPKPGGSIIVTSSMASVSGSVSDISYCKYSPNSSTLLQPHES